MKAVGRQAGLHRTDMTPFIIASVGGVTPASQLERRLSSTFFELDLMAKTPQPKLKLMVASTVYGFETKLEQIWRCAFGVWL